LSSGEEYRLVWSRRSLETLERLPLPLRRRLHRAVGTLQDLPRINVRKIVGREEFRFRTGDFDVLFDIHEGTVQVLSIRRSGEDPRYY